MLTPLSLVLGSHKNSQLNLLEFVKLDYLWGISENPYFCILMYYLLEHKTSALLSAGFEFFGTGVPFGDPERPTSRRSGKTENADGPEISDRPGQIGGGSRENGT